MATNDPPPNVKIVEPRVVQVGDSFKVELVVLPDDNRLEWIVDPPRGVTSTVVSEPEAETAILEVPPEVKRVHVKLVAKDATDTEAWAYPYPPMTQAWLKKTAAAQAGNGNANGDGPPPPTTTVTQGPSPWQVDLLRTNIPDTDDLLLWTIIKYSTDAIGYDKYAEFMNWAFCGDASTPTPSDLTGFAGVNQTDARNEITALSARRALPFPDIEPYRVLKAATELFLMAQCGVALNATEATKLAADAGADLDVRQRSNFDPSTNIQALYDSYLVKINGTSNSMTLPYLELIREKLGDVRVRSTKGSGVLAEERLLAEQCYGIIKDKLTKPCFLELIWSYWHEEGMLVQTMNALAMRFQNRRLRKSDPLANLEVDPLRPLNNLLWGWVQDEQQRLTVHRRAYEYDHEYGMTLFGKAVPRIRSADSRSTFIEAFHTLLQRCAYFYKEYDDKTVVPDAFPVLNALREVHLILSEGAHNQYGDLPWVSRQEMLMQEWILARPEFREFLPTRIMVAYPEPWMDRVDAMKRLQTWTDTSVRHFRDLGIMGEKILLSIRFGNWSDITNQNFAANWVIFWREEIQWYINSYESVTGVDVSSGPIDTQTAGQARARFLQPAVHLNQRLAQQRSARGLGTPVS